MYPVIKASHKSSLLFPSRQDLISKLFTLQFSQQSQNITGNVRLEGVFVAGVLT